MQPVRIAVASGKGGTGKTLLSTSLAWLLARRGQAVTFVDTDVAEPNGHLFLRPGDLQRERVTVPTPGLAGDSCAGCGDCERLCGFRAIRVTAGGDSVRVNAAACAACGTCVLACPDDALVERPREVGTIERGATTAPPLRFWSAALDVGEGKAAPLIRALLRRVRADPTPAEVVVIDAPPGVAAPTMNVVRRVDHVVLVTEPTPFGAHDLDLALQMCEGLGRPLSVVLNRSDLGDAGGVEALVAARELQLLARIPFDPHIAAAHAGRRVAAEAAPAMHAAVEQLRGSLPCLR